MRNPGAVINTDVGALEAYRRRKMKAVEQENIREKVEQLSEDINEIKMLLRKLIG